MSKRDRSLHKAIRRLETRQRRDMAALKRDLIHAVLAATAPDRKAREPKLADVEPADDWMVRTSA